MRRAVIAALIFLIAFSLLLFLYTALSLDFISAEDRSGLPAAAGSTPAELNASPDPEYEEAILTDGSISTGEKDGEDQVFQNIAMEALGFGEYVRYDEDEMRIYPSGDERNDISVSIEGTRIMQRMYIKDIYSGYEYTVYPRDDHFFFLAGVTAAPVAGYLEKHTSPMTKDFRIVDPSGSYSPRLAILEEAGVVIVNDTRLDTMVNERFVIRNVGEIYVGEKIFSSLNNVAGSGSVTGWIIYEVPDNFSLSENTFMEWNIGDDRIYWKLHDILVDLRVKKNPDTGRITISYYGGGEGYLVRAVRADLVKADGSVDEKFIEAGDGEEFLPETGIRFAGTPGEPDLLTVKVIRLDGEEFVKYQKEI